ncbi:MAG: hypothetical protein WCB23_13080 [Pseudolabrys sp.]
MAGSVDPFSLLTQGFEQTRKAMESYLDFFQKNIRAAPLLDADLNQKMKTYMEQNIAAVSQFAHCKTSGGSNLSLCNRNGELSLSKRKSYPRRRLKMQRM